jgi:CxxC motif-containing protein (DUF1111 family)
MPIVSDGQLPESFLLLSPLIFEPLAYLGTTRTQNRIRARHSDLLLTGSRKAAVAQQVQDTTPYSEHHLHDVGTSVADRLRIGLTCVQVLGTHNALCCQTLTEWFAGNADGLAWQVMSELLVGLTRQV